MRRQTGWLNLLMSALGAVVACPSQAQATQTGIHRAAFATELPMGPWGLYAVGNLAPSYLANRFKGQLFTFPLVIGQRRTESLLRPVLEADGKSHLRLQKVALERRSMGMAPMQAADDDRLETAAMLYGNRMARVTNADADGMLWTLHIPFAPAELAQNVGGPGGSEETGWGAGDAVVSLFPAYAEPNMDGLLVRITLRNRSHAPQTWYVDLLGGLALLSENFDLKDLKMHTDSDAKASLLQHKNSEAAFALTADTVPYPVHVYTVRNTYFGPEGRIADRDKNGVALPPGRLGAKDAPEENIAKAAGQAPAGPAGLWALTRVDDISIGPGEETTFTLCIGVGKDTEEARHSASALSLLAADSAPDGKLPRSGAYTKALAAHRISQPSTGDTGLDHLLAQSYANVPFDNWRRVGVPSRQWSLPASHGAYRPVEGGFIGLGWADLRADWAAAQLNAWFLAVGDPEAPIKLPQTVAPINLFALWELYQQTLDRKLLEHFYPFARRRYREMLSAGRAGTNNWLFSWKTGMQERDGDKGTMAAGFKGVDNRVYSPDYSAFVIRSARILQRMATVLEHSPNEMLGYAHDAEEATQTLNSTLWDAKRGSYVSRPVAPSDAASVPIDELTGLLPLATGSDALDPVQRASLLNRLTDPTLFWSTAGLRSVAKSSAHYMPHDPGNGAVAFGTNWLLWKALLDLGEADTAHTLAMNLLRSYHAAQISTDACPEALDGETGLACGATDVSGDAGALLDMHAAYHQVGNIATGWNLLLLDRRYDRSSDMMRVVFRPVEKNGSAILICVMGKPNGKYMLQGATVHEATADADGVLTLSLTPSSTTQELTVQPSAKP
jgi:hypothetical protein